MDIKVCAVSEIWSGLKLVVPCPNANHNFRYPESAWIPANLLSTKTLPTRFPGTNRQLSPARSGRIQTAGLPQWPANRKRITGNYRISVRRLAAGLQRYPCGGSPAAVSETNGRHRGSFCLEPHEKYPDITAAPWHKPNQCGGNASLAVHRNGNPATAEQDRVPWRIGSATPGPLPGKRSDHFIIELSWTPAQLSFADVLHLPARLPYRLYLHREAEPADAERYQTIFAREEGSVAAPTAGLHFTDQLMRKLAEHPFVPNT